MVFLINYLIPFYADDYGWAFISNQPNLKIHHLPDIFISQYNYYHSWGGRNIAHGMLQLLLMFKNKLLLAVVQTTWFVATILVSCALAYGIKFRQQMDLKLLFTIFAAFWVLHPCLGEANFWLTGACNYLFTPLVVLLFLLPFRWLIDDFIYPGSVLPLVNKYLKILLISLWLALSFIAGWTNENLVVGALFLVIVFLWFSYWKKRQVPFYIYIGIFFFLAGVKMLLFAPGNQHRALTDMAWMTVPKYIIFLQHFGYFLRNELIEILIFLVFFVLYKQSKQLALSKLALLIFITGVLVDFIMIFSPQMPWRTFTSGFLLKFIAIVSLFNRNLLLQYRFRKVVWLLYGVFALSMLHAVIAYSAIYRVEQQRLQILAHADKNAVVALPLYPIRSLEGWVVFVSDIHPEKDYWVNTSLANYYGFKQGVIGVEVAHAKN
jgi:hypothetical protein